MTADSTREDFYRYVAQTSPHPMGLEVVRAEGCYLFTGNGRSYIDGLSGIAVMNIGHGNVPVQSAITRQVEKYLHTMVYGEFIQEPQVQLARLLAEISPLPFPRIYFTNSGAEAVEGALKLARKYTGKTRIIAFEGAYHGDTLGALSVCGVPVFRQPFEPLLPDVLFLPYGVPEALEKIDSSVAGVIVEPIQGEAGIRIPSPDFLRALRERCTETGALLIFDEVQTGFGRTGRWFACEHSGVIPDVLIVAKALGGGMPLGAFLAPPTVMESLAQDPPFSHVTTFGGHPVCCAAAITSIRFIRQNQLLKNAENMGHYLLSRLQEMQKKFSLIRDVRGVGLLLAIEVSSPLQAEKVVDLCLQRGLLIGTFLFNPASIRFTPPLILTPSIADRSLQILKEAFQSGASEKTGLRI